MSSTTKRTDDEAIILALLSSRTQAEASRKLGINSNLISERKQDKEFIAKYDAYKSTLIENTANKLLTANAVTDSEVRRQAQHGCVYHTSRKETGGLRKAV